MDGVLEGNRSRLKVLRSEKRALVSELRVKRAQKKSIDVEMVQLRADIRRVLGSKNGDKESNLPESDPQDAAGGVQEVV